LEKRRQLFISAQLFQGEVSDVRRLFVEWHLECDNSFILWIMDIYFSSTDPRLVPITAAACL